ncbi:uncharacterized protein EI90DRAFT_3054201 [Cantharellus anzutake]|uniref:uncharacterized protein n=1 Tax=Cantharellus anzutake TaxID=1750568 RepID=UPI00190310DF|nr:uncharacterized protein EI90DRAFT_3054201 [Cantharellus anzutake]KAF8332736.1 hypothetical protein EI90DRAFT_3054201 [Cantharellus anzutake]
MEAHQKLVPSHAAGACTTPPPPPSPTHHALQNTPTVTSTFDVDMIAHTLGNDPIPGERGEQKSYKAVLSSDTYMLQPHMPPVTTPPRPQALTSSTSETLKRLRSPESAKIQGPTLAPPRVMFRVPANTDDPFLANYNTPVATTLPANIHPNPATTDTNSSTDPPCLTRFPAPTDAPAQATATALRPLDDNPDYNYIDLMGELANFRAHGARPARILANIDETHFNQWITTPRAILIYPLDAKHSPENDHKTRNDLTIFLTRAFPLSAPFIKVRPPIAKGYDPTGAPWGFLIEGLHPSHAHLLVTRHLWMSRSICFIAIELATYCPTSYVVTLKDLGANLDESAVVANAVSQKIQEPNSIFKTFLEKANIDKDDIARIANSCVATPRGYGPATHLSRLTAMERRIPPTNIDASMWEIHLPSPFFCVTDRAPGTMNNIHDQWTGLFKLSTFSGNTTGNGHAVGGLIYCHTCKAIDHIFSVCPIHDHYTWCELNPSAGKPEPGPSTPQSPPPNRNWKPHGRGRGKGRGLGPGNHAWS